MLKSWEAVCYVIALEEVVRVTSDARETRPIARVRRRYSV